MFRYPPQSCTYFYHPFPKLGRNVFTLPRWGGEVVTFSRLPPSCRYQAEGRRWIQLHQQTDLFPYRYSVNQKLKQACQLTDLEEALSGRQVERRLPRVVPRVDLAAFAHENPDDLDAAVEAGQVQRREAVLLRNVHHPRVRPYHGVDGAGVALRWKIHKMDRLFCNVDFFRGRLVLREFIPCTELLKRV